LDQEAAPVGTISQEDIGVAERGPQRSTGKNAVQILALGRRLRPGRCRREELCKDEERGRGKS
jgi:hypothetical protein